MSRIVRFTFNPYQENTFLIYDNTKQCVIIDPGCYTQQERDKLTGYISEKKLTPVLLLNTHCHIDHVLGNKYIKELYDIPFYMHKADIPVLEAVPNYSRMMGIDAEPSPVADKYLEHGDTVSFGETEYEVRFTPGHSPGSISFYNKAGNYVVAGDVLFSGSIGRTDLPGGDFDTLEDSIKQQLYTLPEETVVYCGHGPETNIGREKRNNPFIRG